MSRISKVAVIGGGLMGSGIAQVSAAAGLKVNLIDVKEAILKTAMSTIEKNVFRGYKKSIESKKIDEASARQEVDKILARINCHAKAEDAVSDVDLVIEAATENLSIKHKIFASIDKAAPAHTIFASNTSSIQIKDICTAVNRTDRFAGLHFFNPVPVMKLLEVVRGPTTSDETFNALLDYGKDIGKTTVKCKDTPGFIVNRLLIPSIFEAIRLVERGDATLEDADTALKLGAGHPMGPFSLADLIGLDTTKAIMDGWHAKYPEAQIFQPSPWLDSLVAEGHLGKKTGRGFYTYDA